MIKRIASLLLFIGICLSQITTIAVFDFENNGLEAHQVRQITSRLESELVKIEGLKVVERNKIDEETFLILKKRHDSSVAVTNSDTKYKVLAIKNEAPDFIKINKKHIFPIGLILILALSIFP